MEQEKNTVWAVAVDQPQKLNPFRITTGQLFLDRGFTQCVKFRGHKLHFARHWHLRVFYDGEEIDRFPATSDETSQFNLAWVKAKENNKMLLVRLGKGDTPSTYSMGEEDAYHPCVEWLIYFGIC